MGLRDFEYIEPRTVKEACAGLTEHPEEARIYAGGTSLLLLMKQGIVRPTYLVNIKKISNLRYIRNDSPTLKIGSLTTHHDLEISPVIKRYFPVVSEAEREIANIRVRSTGTVGGNLGFAEPLTDLPPIFIALDASVRIEGPQAERTIPLEELFAGYYETTMQPGELLTEILIHQAPPNSGLKYIRFSAGSDKPAVGCAVGVTLDAGSGACREARIVLGCVAPTPLRVREAEAILKGKEFRPELAEQAAQIAARACSPLADLRGSEDYKRDIVRVLTRRAVAEAYQKAGAARA